MQNIKHKFVVISGKGGVGKTTVAVNLAYALSQRGYKVAILDTDLHGPNVPKMLGIEGKTLTASGGKITPFKINENLKAVSIGLIGNKADTPIVWRGPLKAAAIKQFIQEVDWGQLDYLLIDSPPGTGDEPLSVCQLIPDMDGSIIVATAQEVVLMDVRKSIIFSQQLKIKIMGIIENMSGLVCPYCGHKIDIFASGKVEELAKEFGVPFLGKIPFSPRIAALADKGESFMAKQKEDDVYKALNGILDNILKQVKGD